MGVDGTFAFLEAQGINGEEVDPATLEGLVHVDVAALFFGYIVATTASILLAQFRAEDSTSPLSVKEVRAVVNNAMVELLHNKLVQSFSMASSILHFDGYPSEQKTQAHEERRRGFDQATAQVRAEVARVSLLMAPRTEPTPDATPIPRSATRKTVRVYKNAIKRWRSARHVDWEAKRALVDGLTKKGWEVCACKGEADVCVALQHRPITVATSDSDFFFHDVDCVLRPNPHKRTEFRKYEQADILQRLNLSKAMWSVVAVTTKNDYARNARGYGLVKNLKEISSIAGVRSLDREEILDQYCDRLTKRGATPVGQDVLDSDHYKRACEIFFYLEENLLAPSTVDRADGDIRGMIHQANVFFARNRVARLGRRPSIVPPVPAKADEAAAPITDEDVFAVCRSLSYKQMLPGNQYPVKTYVRPESVNETPEQKPTKKKRKKKKKKEKKRKQPVIYNPSSRKARTEPSDTASQGTAKSTTPSAVTDLALSSSYGSVSLNCGTIAKRLRESVLRNFNAPLDQQSALPKLLHKVLQEMVRIATELTRYAQLAVELHIAHVMDAYPSMQQADIDHRARSLEPYGGYKGAGFFKNLLYDIFTLRETASRSGRKRSDTPTNRIVAEVAQHLEDALTAAGITFPPLNGFLSTGLTHLFDHAGARLCDQIQTHYVRNISELHARLRRVNPAWCHGDGRAIISSIDAKKGTSSTMDQMSLFWVLNSNLPVAQQMKFFPESGFTDSHFFITELMILDAIYGLKGETDKAMVGLIRDVYGNTMTAATDYVANYPGQLVYCLFFDRTLGYHRNTTFAAQDPRLHHLLVPHFLELGDQQGQYNTLVSALRHDPRSKPAKYALQDFIKRKLKTPEDQKRAVDIGATKLKHVLTGTICTNGHEIKALAYSLLKHKPPTKHVANTTRQKLLDIRQELASVEQIQHEFPDQSEFRVTGIDPGICNTATATVIKSQTQHVMRNISIPGSASRHSIKVFNDGLERAKRHSKHTVTLPGQEPRELNIQQIEQQIQPVVCAQAQGGQLAAWRAISSSIREHVLSVLIVQAPLRAFYTTTIFKIKSMHLKQAKTATLDRSVTKLCNAGGLAKKATEGRKPLFVVGDGQFSCGNKPMVHQKFVQALKNKVRDNA